MLVAVKRHRVVTKTTALPSSLIQAGDWHCISANSSGVDLAETDLLLIYLFKLPDAIYKSFTPADPV